MSFFSMPMLTLYFLLFPLFVDITITAGHLAFEDVWIKTALRNATMAGMAQMKALNQNTLQQGTYVLNVTDAEKEAQKLWNTETQTWTPTGTPLQATFTPSAVNQTTPPGMYDTLTGTVKWTLSEPLVNAFLHRFDHNHHSTFGLTITQHMTATLPSHISSGTPSNGHVLMARSSSPNSSLPKLHSSLPKTTLPTLHSSLPKTTLPPPITNPFDNGSYSMKASLQ